MKIVINISTHFKTFFLCLNTYCPLKVGFAQWTSFLHKLLTCIFIHDKTHQHIWSGQLRTSSVRVVALWEHKSSRRRSKLITNNVVHMRFFLTRQPPVGQGFLIHDDSRSHTTTHHIRYGSYGRVISSSQRTLPDNTHTTLTTDKRPCLLWDSNPQSQQASGRRPTP